MTVVTAAIWDPDGGHRVLDLGEFHEVWMQGVSIGSDAECAIQLPGLEPVAAVVEGRGNHQVFRELSTKAYFEKCDWPLQTDSRIDYERFRLGDYSIQFGENEPPGRPA